MKNLLAFTFLLNLEDTENHQLSNLYKRIKVEVLAGPFGVHWL